MANLTEADLEDFVFYQDNETESLNSDSDDDLAEDVEFEIYLQFHILIKNKILKISFCKISHFS